jgi:hypothetical protein
MRPVAGACHFVSRLITRITSMNAGPGDHSRQLEEVTDVDQLSQVIRPRSGPMSHNSRLEMSNFTNRCTSACFRDQRPIEPIGFVVMTAGHGRHLSPFLPQRGRPAQWTRLVREGEEAARIRD